MVDFLVIGAGVAGLSAAKALDHHGYSVLVLEKSRGLGGRAATRRLEGARIDHGAQYFTVRDERFQHYVNGWLEQGKVFIWSHGFHSFDTQGLSAAKPGHPRYAFAQGMNTIGKLLAKDLTIRTETRATSATPSKQGWLLSSESGESFSASNLIIAIPPEQALALLNFESPELNKQLQNVSLSPCFALMLGYPVELAPSWQGINVQSPTSPLAWLAHDSGKRSNQELLVLTLHSTANFASHHFDARPEDIGQLMLKALTDIDSKYAKPLFQNLHRWKYAKVVKPLGQSFISHQHRLFFCGDWCRGAKLEDAFISGLELAETLIKPRL